MLYQITHQITYRYAEPVGLEPHTLRLRPRSDNTQKLHSFRLTVEPTPAGISEAIDLDGNAIAQVWFQSPTDRLIVTAISEVETFRTNPFDFLLAPWATQLPIDYPTSMLVQLQPYLGGYLGAIAGGTGFDPVAAQLAQEIAYTCDRQIVSFLGTLNQRIYENCEYILRETGDPFPPSITWTQKAGTCRDFALLFMECCRSLGLAARFVSGYQEGDPESEKHLHAWVEVYLPAAGWRGYDPTQGLAVSDRHIPLVASPFPNMTTPATGKLKTSNVRSTMTYDLAILANRERG
ncbi:Transglutaminase-like domain-containing protein [Tumidithrix helvetica PCC 7403]|uniref:transglutaminase family protein n=1 Tax=Tumidithrix helvetica TaxID=3457545 RepID=UPI003CA68383